MSVTRQKVFSNMIWRFLERTGAQLVQFIVAIVLARILSPEDYGTIALVTVFITILNVFVDSGLGTALVQKKDADNIDFSTVFYTNLIFCLVLYVILFIMSPFIARFVNCCATSAHTPNPVYAIQIPTSAATKVPTSVAKKNFLN